jgi:hypothetical protein
MVNRLIPPTAVRLDDDKAERVRRNHDERIRELQAVPVVRGNLIKGIELADATTTPISHGLGRRATVFVSPAQATSGATTGRIREIRSADYDQRKFVVLQADGWGETVTVDLWVF